MINPVSSVTQSQPVSQPSATSDQKQTQSTAPPASQADSVQLSKAAQATLAAFQEATETPTQTAKEANHGDLQARRLLAKEAAKASIDK